MAPDAGHLKAVLTPELFLEMTNKWIPFPKSEPFDMGKAIDWIFHELGEDEEALKQRVWPALKALSQYSLSDFPDLNKLLPPVDDADFPVQALGLQLVLDQAPRSFLEGIDRRYVNAFFGVICVRIAQGWQKLPPSKRPTSWERWEALGTSFEYWILVRLWFGATLVHQESTQDQAASFTEETRRAVEEHYGKTDPLRGDSRLQDLWAFPKMLAAGGPPQGASAADGQWWLGLLMDVHKTIIDAYGRYPYQNSEMGRLSSPEEIEWMEKAEAFREPPEDVRRKIREDVEKGIWTPLGADWKGTEWKLRT
jgi:hypothetical protein